MRCKKCHKDIVLYEDWGDYDDACEWACNCHSYLISDCPVCKKETLFRYTDLDNLDKDYAVCMVCNHKKQVK